MEEALSTLEAELRRRAPTISAALRPGLDAGQIQALLAEFPHQVPAELRTLYAWHDGTDLVSGPWRAELFPSGGWLPLADALKTWANAMEGNRQQGEVIWDPCWLPIASDGKDGFDAVECGSGQGRVVAFYYVDLPGFRCEHAGLPDMVAALIRRWRAGVYWEADLGAVAWDKRGLAALLRSEDAEPPDIDQLVRDLAMGPEPDVTQALHLLRTRLYPEAVPALIAMLGDRSSPMRPYAIELLGAIGDPAAIPALQAAAEHDPEPYIRRFAQSVLRGFGLP